MSVSKIFVGVHGIGDQTECETIQTIIEQVTGYQGSALRVPLGKISSALTALRGLVHSGGRGKATEWPMPGQGSGLRLALEPGWVEGKSISRQSTEQPVDTSRRLARKIS